MFGLTKSYAIIIGVSGIVLTGALIPVVTQAQEKWLTAQAAPGVPGVGGLPGVPPVAPDAFNAPSQVGNITPPSAIAPRPRQIRPRRVPIEPVPMPGDDRRPLPALQASPDIRTMPPSDTSVLSGISGKVIFTPICSVTAPSTTCQARPYTGLLKISTAARDRVVRVGADEQGAFRLKLTPGLYVIEPDASNFQIGTSQTFTVISSVVRQMEFSFQGTLPPGTAAPAAIVR